MPTQDLTDAINREPFWKPNLNPRIGVPLV
jgi:hypothetical protein